MRVVWDQEMMPVMNIEIAITMSIAMAVLTLTIWSKRYYHRFVVKLPLESVFGTTANPDI